MKRSYTKCPCETCITFAICKGKDEVECPILYKYMRAGIKNNRISHPKKKYRKRKIESIFGRKIDTYRVSNVFKKNPDLILWWRKLAIKKGSR